MSCACTREPIPRVNELIFGFVFVRVGWRDWYVPEMNNLGGATMLMIAYYAVSRASAK